MIRLEPRVSFPDNKDFLAEVKAFVSPMVFFKVNYIVYICWVRLDVKLDLYNILPRKVASAMDLTFFGGLLAAFCYFYYCIIYGLAKKDVDDNDDDDDRRVRLSVRISMRSLRCSPEIQSRCGCC